MNQSSVWAKRLPWWMVVGVLGGIGGGVVGGGWYALRPPDDGPEVAYRPLLPVGSYPTRPLAAGEVAPQAEADGWVNRPPATAGKLVVLDIWTGWCPYCRANAPALVHAYDTYHLRGVEFVSLTDMPRRLAAEFAAEFRVLWPSGYGASLASLARFGVYEPELRSRPLDAPKESASEVSPTTFLLGPDGRVLWHDGQARLKHTDADVWAAELDAAIQTHLNP